MKIEIKYSHCVELTNNKKIKLVDLKHSKSKSSYFLENNKNEEVNIINVDDCIFKDSDQKSCDWAIETKEIIFFIELKGSDFNSGFKQLYLTVNSLESFFKNKTLKARLVLSKVTDIQILTRNISYIKLAKKLNFIPNKNDNIVFKNKEITDKL